MIQTRFRILNWVTIALLLLLLCGFQTSIWFQLTSGAPAPQLWLTVILYLVLYRSFFHALGFSYFLALIIKSFSAVSLGMLLPLFLILITPASYLKSRMFWPSTRFFLIATFLFTLSYQICIYLLSFYLEINPAPLAFFNRLMELILTVLCAAPTYWLLNLLDRLTLPEILDTQGARE